MDIKELDEWDFPDTVQVPNGYDMSSEPDLTRRNFLILIEEHNKLVAAYKEITSPEGLPKY
jgi:hypothetical protein